MNNTNVNYQDKPYGIEIKIFKPLYGDDKMGYFIYIRESILRAAIKENKLIQVDIPGICKNVIKPMEWIATGKVLYKEFKVKGHPMKLIGNYLHKPEINGTETA